jgi:aminocarboxymuconate-semialdehyde decarboxylase
VIQAADGGAPVTDIHAHIVPRATVEQLQRTHPSIAPVEVRDEGGFFLGYPSGRRSGPIPDGMIDAEPRLEDMRKQRVDHQAISVPPTHFFYGVDAAASAGLAELQNDGMREVVGRHPDAFSMLATLPMQNPAAAVREIERLAGDRAVRGIEICTNIAGKNLDDASFEDVWAAAEQAGLPILLHPDNVAGADRLQRYYLQNFIGNPLDSTIAAASLIFGGVFDRYPGLRFGLCHGGGFLPYQIGRWDHGWACRAEAKVQISRAPSSYLDHFVIDSLTHDPVSLRLLVERMGPDGVALGSDYPFDMADPDPLGSLERAGLSPEVVGRIASQAPQRFLRPASAEGLAGA